MSYIPPAKLTTGEAYTGNKQFIGNGVKRSCGKCGQHAPVSGFKLKKPWGMVCAKCRGLA